MSRVGGTPPPTPPLYRLWEGGSATAVQRSSLENSPRVSTVVSTVVSKEFGQCPTVASGETARTTTGSSVAQTAKSVA